MMRFRLNISVRFWCVLGALSVAMTGMGVVAFTGLGTLRDASEGLSRAVSETELDGQVRAGLLDLRGQLVVYASTTDSGERADARAAIEDAIAGLDRGFARMKESYAGRAVDSNLTHAQDAPYRRIRELWRQGLFDRPAERGNALRAVHMEAGRAARAAQELAERDVQLAAAARRDADAAYNSTARVVLLVLVGALLAGIGMVVWLTRSIVPRTRAYSAFAADVSAGRNDGRLRPVGRDELAELGRSLDTMVEHQQSAERYGRTQAEFVDTLQVTEGEHEAHDVLKRHLERTIGNSRVVIFNRNNSDDRLEPVTEVSPDSALVEALEGARPRSCLAVRFARRYERGESVDPLVPCDVCGKVAADLTCDPLLVGGQVIGSVLVEHARPLSPQEDQRIRESVGQAAPVLANLRNLELAETRAATDALTGLANTRAAHDTLKRMVAQASRTITPLAALLIDLDHFKQVNDSYGHARGDEVLAAAAEAMRAAVRESDFLGRFGGEEFLVLLPNTDRDGAARVAEAIRVAVASVTVPRVDRDITTCVGVAVLPNDAGDAETLLRCADRALYMAKANGRNRVEVSEPRAPAPPAAA